MSQSNIQINRGFRSRSLFTLFALLLGVGWLLNPLVSSKNASDLQQTHLRAQGLAYQLFEIQDLGQAQRLPASSSSEGQIGKDLWGQQYAYYFSSNRQVLMVSKGPNQRFDTVIDDQFVRNQSDIFKGDDIGLWVSRETKSATLTK